MRHHARPHVIAVGFHPFDTCRCGDDRIGVFGRKFPTARRAAGLHEHGPPLRRTHRVQGATAAVVTTFEVDGVDFGAVRVDAAFRVHNHGVGFPGIPELTHQVDVFVGHVVAQVVLG